VAPSDVPTPAVLIPSVTVADQPIVDGKVIVARVVSAGPGWLVIHAQSDGQPGPVLGYSPVKEGDNLDLVVLIDATKASETLYAMLHSDAGQVGTYEFPGSDGPVLVDGQVVAPTFAVTGGLASAQTPEATPILPTAAPSATAVATPSGGGSLPTAVAGEAEVEMEDFQFVPKLLVVRAGTTVKFANKDRAVHTATSDTDVFDSGTLNKGEEFSFTFTQPGEYPYYCTLHGGPGGVGMAGKIVVVP
jgi:plastocyanin